ncbi:MAG: hypothetical protein ACI9KN_000633, partial [Gammaproteobacteria bacterium]
VVDRDLVDQVVEVEDARKLSDRMAKHYGPNASGTILIKHQSAVTNFLDKAQIKQDYEAELESLLTSTTGASRVHIFDHTVRASDPAIREQKQTREPATLVHNDYTANSGVQCLRENLPDEAGELSKKRFLIINLWRPLVDPVENFPLAFCDASSIAATDLVVTERRSPDHIGEISLATYNPAHRWLYFPDMRPNEVLLFKTFDSSAQGRHGCGVHTAIDIPGTPADVKPRESIESRAFVFFD